MDGCSSACLAPAILDPSALSCVWVAEFLHLTVNRQCLLARGSPVCHCLSVIPSTWTDCYSCLWFPVVLLIP